MALLRLTLQSLKDLDMGSIDVAFRTHLERVVKDCLDRPGDKRSRKVVIELIAVPIPVPVIQNIIDCDGVSATIKVKSMLPDYESRTLDFGVRSDGSLVFREHSPTDHRQGILLPSADTDQDEEKN